MAWSSRIDSRRSTSPRIWCRRKLARPAVFTARMAASAWRVSSSTLLPCEGASDMPMLQVSVNAAPSLLKGCATTFSTRRAVASAAAASAPPSSSANWSLPRRASVSPWRRQPWTRRATSISTRSPVAWPRLSLMWRKRSRSTTSSAKPPPSRRTVAAASVTQAASRARLARPVRASVWARASMRSCAAMRSVRSRNEYTRPRGLPPWNSGRVTRSSTCPECSSMRSQAVTSAASRKACSRCS